jgi:hypothetical protein
MLKNGKEYAALEIVVREKDWTAFNFVFKDGLLATCPA